MPQAGLRYGWISLVAVALGFAALFAFGPDRAPIEPEVPPAFALSEILTDPASRQAINALRAAAPGAFAELETAARYASADGAGPDDLSYLLRGALFGQFRAQALTMRSAESAQYQTIMAGLADGLGQLKSANSPWCKGPTLISYLAQNDEDLVPSLLAEFPYQSPQYDWAMEWMAGILATTTSARRAPRRYQRPTAYDEAVLQQEGIALGSEQWALALQVAAFANAEGVSYAKMQDVIAGLNICDLGIAVETVSARLPGEVRARIWADLMPEIMAGNTPYVIWRVNDYFFIG